MVRRADAVIFKGKAYAVQGPQLKPGDRAPDFACVNSALEVVTLAQTPAKIRLFSAVPSLDTPVCSEQTRRFDKELASLGDRVVCYTVSLDLPFAQKRFCTTESIGNVQTLSDTHDHSFGSNYGVLIEGLPLRLLARAVFIVDGRGVLSYAEYVPEVGKHPDYESAMAALRSAAG